MSRSFLTQTYPSSELSRTRRDTAKLAGYLRPLRNSNDTIPQPVSLREICLLELTTPHHGPASTFVSGEAVDVLTRRMCNSRLILDLKAGAPKRKFLKNMPRCQCHVPPNFLAQELGFAVHDCFCVSPRWVIVACSNDLGEPDDGPSESTLRLSNIV